MVIQSLQVVYGKSCSTRIFEAIPVSLCSSDQPFHRENLFHMVVLRCWPPAVYCYRHFGLVYQSLQHLKSHPFRDALPR